MHSNKVLFHTYINAFFGRVISDAYGMIAVCQWSIYLGCAGASTGQVPAADSEALSRVIASGHEGLTRVLVAGDEVLSVVISGMQCRS